GYGGGVRLAPGLRPFSPSGPSPGSRIGGPRSRRWRGCCRAGGERGLRSAARVLAARTSLIPPGLKPTAQGALPVSARRAEFRGVTRPPAAGAGAGAVKAAAPRSPPPAAAPGPPPPRAPL